MLKPGLTSIEPPAPLRRDAILRFSREPDFATSIRFSRASDYAASMITNSPLTHRLATSQQSEPAVAGHTELRDHQAKGPNTISVSADVRRSQTGERTPANTASSRRPPVQLPLTGCAEDTVLESNALHQEGDTASPDGRQSPLPTRATSISPRLALSQHEKRHGGLLDWLRNSIGMGRVSQ